MRAADGCSLDVATMDLAVVNPAGKAAESARIDLPRDGSRDSSGGGAQRGSGADPVSLIDWFEQTSRLHAQRTAVVCGAEEIAYAGLNRAANRIAHRLRAMQLPKGAIVGLYLDRSIAMLSAMLGVLKAGGVYLPLDATYPVGRVCETLDDARPAILITSERLGAALPGIEARMVLLGGAEQAAETDAEEGDPALETGPDLGPDLGPDDVAYVMYTSGSTGRPKGVLVTHGNVMRLIEQTRPWFAFDERDVWTMFHSFAFDFSVWEIWGALVTGGKLVVIPFAISRSPEEFYALLAEQRVTVLNQTPSAFALLNQVEEAGGVRPLALRVVIFGGEALQYRTLGSWFERHAEDRPRLVNMYGITETTVHVTYRVITERDALHEQESLIGEPIPDLTIHLLDAGTGEVAGGEVGEICIGGAGVARGYLNRPEMTAARFVPDPFAADGALLYRSGDLARRRPDGELVYLGRGDGQVKINGFRIELGEIEAALAHYPGVKQVCVTAQADAQGRQRLAAYVVRAEESRMAAHELREFLATRLPAQMLPSFYTQLSSFPLTGNGKIDRAALPRPTPEAFGSSAIERGSPMAERVAVIWRRVLDVSHVGLDDNFFDAGGSSLLLIAVRSALQTELARPIPVTWMFEFTTIRALADKLTEALAEGSSAASLVAAPERRPGVQTVQEQARRQRDAFERMRAAKGGKR